MSRAVRFDHYGGVDVLQVVDVEPPVPGSDQMLVRVKAAGINPGEISIREGLLDSRWPATFPSGEGTDLAGVVEEVGDGVSTFKVGDEVIGFTDNRASQAELVLVDEDKAVTRPPGVPWEQAGALAVAGTTAYAAVRAVDLRPQETVVVSGAAGGVGTIAVQLAGLEGATVIGLASPPHHAWLREHGVTPIEYGDGVAERIMATARPHVHAFIDTFGSGYVDLAIGLGVAPERIDTIADFEAPQKHPGVKTDGHAAGASAQVLGVLARLIDEGRLEIPIAAVYPLERVQDAYRELSERHVLGKVVLVP